MIYESKAITALEVRDCKFDLLDALKIWGWEEILRSNGVIYFRRPYREERS